MSAAVFLDRDGTIIEDYGYNHRPEDQLTFLPGVFEALRRLQEAGLALVLITNQSGIGRGQFSEEQYGLFHGEMLARLKEEGVAIDGAYYCPHAPEVGCDCRKPGTAMLERAAIDLDLDLTASFFVGDKDEDVMAGQAAGCRTLRIVSERYPMQVEPDFRISSLAEAPELILSQIDS